MKVIFGLGNPGKKYEYTKHNIGFLTIDDLAKQLGVNAFTSTNAKFNALITEARVNGKKVLLVKPLTYMNLSGEAVRPIVDFFKIETENILVVYDDLDLPFGKIRIREKGSSGGHNGMKSIIAHLGTEEFKRIRIGIDHPKKTSVVDYVLTKFTKEENDVIHSSMDTVCKAIIDWVNEVDFKKIMSTYQ